MNKKNLSYYPKAIRENFSHMPEISTIPYREKLEKNVSFFSNRMERTIRMINIMSDKSLEALASWVGTWNRSNPSKAVKI